MHACIAAFSAGVPVVPMAYSRKFNGLFGTLGYKRVADCKDGKSRSRFGACGSGFKERSLMGLEVQDGLLAVKDRIARYEASLAKALSGVSQ